MATYPCAEAELRKSRGITLTMMTGLAAACSQQADVDQLALNMDQAQPRRCVDGQNQLVSDSLCTNSLASSDSAAPSGSTSRSGGGIIYPYFWYYGGYVSQGSGSGIMAGGTRTALNAPAPITRGGLGTTAARRSSPVGA